jgi:molybdopterin molybdotransferase
MPGRLALRSVTEARALLAGFAPLPTEPVALWAAAGRVLAGDFVAPEPLPPLRRAAMDGFAVRAADVAGASDDAPVTLAVVGTVPMGDVWAGEVAPGQAVAIATGGAVPAGADAVVMLERTRLGDGGGVEFSRAPLPCENVVAVGGDVAAGQRLLLAGARLRAQDLAALAAFGATEIVVFRAPRVALLSTGSEIVAPGVRPRPGQVRDMNQVALAAQAARAGAVVTPLGIVADDAGALAAAIDRALGDHDAVLISGGSSIGARDLTAVAVDALGAELVFHGVDVRPGKPLLVARRGDRPIVGLPGVPLAAMVIFDVFVAPLLARLSGERLEATDPIPTWRARRAARLGAAVASVAGREDYVRVRLLGRSSADALPLAEPLPGGAAAVANLVRADGLVIVPAAATTLAAGSLVEVFLYA